MVQQNQLGEKMAVRGPIVNKIEVVHR